MDAYADGGGVSATGIADSGEEAAAPGNLVDGGVTDGDTPVAGITTGSKPSGSLYNEDEFVVSLANVAEDGDGEDTEDECKASQGVVREDKSPGGKADAGEAGGSVADASIIDGRVPSGTAVVGNPSRGDVTVAGVSDGPITNGDEVVKSAADEVEDGGVATAGIVAAGCETAGDVSQF